MEMDYSLFHSKFARLSSYEQDDIRYLKVKKTKKQSPLHVKGFESIKL